MSARQIVYQTGSLTHDAALKAIATGAAAASQLSLPVAIAVVDPSGQMIASVRMSGAPELALRVATKKAWTSAQTGAPSGDVIHFIAGDPGSSISMPHVTDFCVIAGGLPINEGELKLGALGVSGGTPDLDLQVASAAVAALAE